MAEATPIGTAIDKRDDRDQNRADQQRNDAVPILPETGRDPIAAEQERTDRAIPRDGRSGDQARSFSDARGRFARYTCALRLPFLEKVFACCASEKRGGDASNSPIFALSAVAMFSKAEVPSRKLRERSRRDRLPATRSWRLRPARPAFPRHSFSRAISVRTVSNSFSELA